MGHPQVTLVSLRIQSSWICLTDKTALKSLGGKKFLASRPTGTSMARIKEEEKAKIYGITQKLLKILQVHDPMFEDYFFTF